MFFAGSVSSRPLVPRRSRCSGPRWRLHQQGGPDMGPVPASHDAVPPRPHPASNPRRVVLLATLAGLVAVGGLAALLLAPTRSARESVVHLHASISVPLGHLDDALEADAAGEADVERAAAAPGPTRDAALAASISAGETSTKAWTSYRSSAAHLPGEARLAARYERDHAAGKKVGARVVIPILQTNAPSVVPTEQVEAAARDRRDLIGLRKLYRRDSDATVRSLDARLSATARGIEVGAGLAAVLVLAGSLVGQRIAVRVVATRRDRSAAADLAEFETSLSRALELAREEDRAFEVATRAATEHAHDATGSMLVADASQASLSAVVGISPCLVKSPDDCPALAAGSPMQFADSGALDACPVLARTTKASGTPCSVTCLPVSVTGRDGAILQLAGPVDRPPAPNTAVRVVVRRVGERITMLRALAQFELQASRDPLTGLYNRRSLEQAVDRLHASDTEYSVAFADLDHFKRLNDVHGHDAGDRALRAFARTVVTCLRPEDLTCRWGGEEFVVVFPACDGGLAVEAMDRVRRALATGSRDAGASAVTVSVGVAEGGGDQLFSETVARADEALHVAKAEGRNRVVLAAGVRGRAATDVR